MRAAAIMSYPGEMIEKIFSAMRGTETSSPWSSYKAYAYGKKAPGWIEAISK